MAVAPPAEPSTLDEAMKAAAVQAASLAILNAVQHLQRTAVLVEATTAAGLVRALSPGGETDPAWTQALDASRQAMDAAVHAYSQAMKVAVELGRATAP